MPVTSPYDQRNPLVAVGSHGPQPHDSTLSEYRLPTQVSDYFNTLFTCSNCDEFEPVPEFYKLIWNHSPNLASVVSFIDFIVTGNFGEQITLDQEKLEMSEELRGYRKPGYHLVQSQHPIEEFDDFRTHLGLLHQFVLQVLQHHDQSESPWVTSQSGKPDLSLTARIQLSQWFAAHVGIQANTNTAHSNPEHELSPENRLKLAQQEPEKASFFGTCLTMLLFKDSEFKQGLRYSVLHEDFIRANQVLPTLFPTVSRVTATHQSMNDPVFRIEKIQGTLEESSLSQVLPWMLHVTSQHLNNKAPVTGPIENVIPMVLYQAWSHLSHQPISPTIIHLEQQVVDHVHQTIQAHDLAKRKQQDNVAKQREATALRKQEQDHWRQQVTSQQMTSPHLGLLDVLEVSRWVRPNSAQGVLEFSAMLIPQHTDSSAYVEQLKHEIGSQHQYQYLSYTELPYEIEATQGRFLRDNLCWARGLGLSLLFQFNQPEELINQIKQVGYSFDKPDYETLLSVAHKAFQDDPHWALHGLRPTGAEKPAALFASVPARNFMPENTEGTSQPLLSTSVEQVLNEIFLAVAAGAREYPGSTLEKEILALAKMRGSLGSSDVIVAAHRVMNKPCLVFEVSDQQGVSVTFSGQREEPETYTRLFHQLKPENGIVPIKQVTYLIQHFSMLPILWLHRQHFSIFLPQQHTLTQQLNRIYTSQEVAAQNGTPNAPTSAQAHPVTKAASEQIKFSHRLSLPGMPKSQQLTIFNILNKDSISPLMTLQLNYLIKKLQQNSKKLLLEVTLINASKPEYPLGKALDRTIRSIGNQPFIVNAHQFVTASKRINNSPKKQWLDTWKVNYQSTGQHNQRMHSLDLCTATLKVDPHAPIISSKSLTQIEHHIKRHLSPNNGLTTQLVFSKSPHLLNNASIEVYLQGVDLIHQKRIQTPQMIKTYLNDVQHLLSFLISTLPQRAL